MRGFVAAPTREGSPPSSFAKVLRKTGLLLARIFDKYGSTYPPLAPSINNTVCKDQPTIRTHKISRSEILNNFGVGISAVWADETDREVRSKGRLLRLRRRSKRERLEISHR
jgi:hypothetical protein